MMPPNDFFEWNRGSGTNFWATGGNWIGGTAPAPTINADVLFANAPTIDTDAANGYGYKSPLEVQTGGMRYVNSLWFETGRDYTLRGLAIYLGGTAANGDTLIASLNNTPGNWQSEHRIDNTIALQLQDANWTATIASFSGGGLRLGGSLHFMKGNLQQRGGGAIHLAGSLNGTQTNQGNLTVATDAGHMILSGNNSNWTGALTVNHGFLVATANNALGSAANARTVTINGNSSGSSLAFRPKFVGTGLNNSGGINYASQQGVTVSGTGYLRPWGSADPYAPHSKLNLRPIGAIYNDGGNNAFAGNITMVGNTWFGSRDGVLTLTGRVNGGFHNNYTFTKVGRGVIALALPQPSSGLAIENNWYQTVIREGVLRVNTKNALPKTARIMFQGGILELGAGGFYGTTAPTGDYAVTWMPGFSGGFSAFGGTREVWLNEGAMLNWGNLGGYHGKPLLLSSAYADSKIIFLNPIDLQTGTNREIRVERGVNSRARAELGGKITKPAHLVREPLIKTGLGTLWLSNQTNDYNNATRIREGVLGGYVPTGSRIDFDGGVFGIDLNFSRTLGTANTQVRWLANRDGGFASYWGTRYVTLGSANSVVTFGQNNFANKWGYSNQGGYLIFGAYDASGTVNFNNRLGLANDYSPSGWGANRVRVIRYRPDIVAPTLGPLGDLPAASVIFSREIDTPPGLSLRSTSYNLYFEGDGRADITHSHQLYESGSPEEQITIGWFGRFVKTRGAHPVLRQDGNIPLTLATGWGAFVGAYHGGSITLDNTGQYVANRINDQVDVQLHSGKFTLAGNLSTHVTETVNDLNLRLGANTVSLLSGAGFRGTSNWSVSLRFNKLFVDTSYSDNGVQHNERPTVNFTSNSPTGFVGTGWPTGAHRLSFANQPANYGGILPYATINATDWAQVVADGGRYYLAPYTAYQTGDNSTWYWGHAAPSANQSITTSRTLNSLKLESGRTITISDNRYLQIYSGGLLATGSSMTSITGGTLYSGGALYAHVYNSAAVGLDISSAISGTSWFIKTGSGVLRLSGNTNANINNTLYIHEGTLALAKTGNGKLRVQNIIVGDHAGVDTLRLDTEQSIVSTASITLRGGHPDPARFLMAEGVLMFNGVIGSGVGIRQTINNLTIEGRGVIDFRGGEGGRANFLIINGTITIGEDSRLFIRNWFEFEDYILIRRNGASSVDLSRVEFVGYGPAFFRDWNSEYYLMTPAPEPATYGAILGAVGLGLWAWQRKRRRTPTRFT